MSLSLDGARRFGFIAALACFFITYLFFSAREFAATILGSHADATSLERAIRLSPGDAEYRNRLGRFIALDSLNPQSSIGPLRAAVDLNPHEPRYWLDLAVAYQNLGDSSSQLDALKHAIAVEPTSPAIAWEAANLLAVQGDIDGALREFRVVVENDPYLPGLALDVCWRVRPDVDMLLQQVVPARTDSLLAFLSLLMKKQQTDGSIKVWNRLLQLHEKFDSRYLLDYVRFLILAHRPDVASETWEQSAPVLGLSGYLPSPDNLMVNGDFSLDVLNGGFDWIYQTQTGVQLLLDPSDFREGHRSLSVSFEGPGLSDAGIHQFVPVRGGMSYDFTAYYKSSEFEGAGGPQIVFRDAYTGQQLYASDSLINADFWKVVHAQFAVPPATSMVILNIERTPAGSPIRGKLWLNGFQLSPEQIPDPKDHS